MAPSNVTWAEDYTWGDSGNGSSTSTSDYNLGTNWSNAPDNNPPPITTNQNATFDSTGNATVNVSTPINPDSWTFTLFSQSYAITGSTVTFGTPTGLRDNSFSAQSIDNVISGIGGVTQSSPGTLTLSGVNTYTGPTQIDATTTLALKGSGSIASTQFTGVQGTLDISQTNAGTTIGGLFDSTRGGIVSLGSRNLTIVGNGTFFTGIIEDGGIAGGSGGGVTIASGSQEFDNANTYTGVTTIAAGAELLLARSTIVVGSIATSSGVVSDGTFDVSGVSSPNATSIKSLSGSAAGIVALGDTTLTLTAASGTFAGKITGTGDNFFGVGNGVGGLSITGGKEILTGANTYTGPTTINGGTLEVDGSIASTSVVVNAGGTLAGTGKIGDPQINAGGTLAPGSAANPYGTMTIVGPLGFSAGSFYNVNINSAGQNSCTNVVGVATIGGGTVNVLAGSGTYGLSTRYTILTATGGINGSFASAKSNLAFLTPSLSYDATNAFLTVTAMEAIVTPSDKAVPDYRTAALTANQRAVAGGLTNAGIQNGGTGRVLTALNQLTAPQARAAFDALSGEGITAAQNIAHRSAELFTSAIFDQTTFYGAGQGPQNSIMLTDASPSGMLGYAPRQGVPIRELADLPGKLHQPAAPVEPQRTWRAWATGFGGFETDHGTSVVGSATQDDTIYGGALGVDYQLTPNYLVGLAVGGSDGSFVVPGRATSGATTGGHMAFYDIATFGRFYGATSTDASFYGNRTARSVPGFGGLSGETERGTFSSHEFRSRIEFGRHVDGYGGTVTPFVALELAELRSDGFSESAITGPGLLALNVSGQSSASVPGFVGARFQRVTPLGNGIVFSPALQVAYVHEFAPQRTQFGALVNLPGSTFLVDGARPGRDAAEVKAGGELALNAHSTLFANFDGEVSGANQFYAGKGGFKYAW